uniref:G_PROTEIN_RECEP_F1_2 domain-containing protein n=1 Tax=Parastrongyloides trichosuri TaxID=131310 RepID=A0A0N4ZTP1_PARTI
MAGTYKTIYNIVLIVIDTPIIPFIIALRILNVRFRSAEKNIVCSLSEKFQITENIKLTGICVILISIIFSITVLTNVYNSFGHVQVLYEDRLNIGYLLKYFFFTIALIWTVRNYKTMFSNNFSSIGTLVKNNNLTKKININSTFNCPINGKLEQDKYFEIFHNQHTNAFKARVSTK